MGFYKRNVNQAMYLGANLARLCPAGSLLTKRPVWVTSTLPISQQLNFNKNCDTSRTLVRDYNSYNRILNRKQLLANNSLSHLLNQNRTLKLAARLVEKSPKQLQPFLKLSLPVRSACLTPSSILEPSWGWG